MRYDLVVEGRTVTARGMDELQVGVTGGRIAALRKGGLSGERTIRAEGCVVFPGFIDAHVHMREPGWEAKEDFRTGSMAAIHGGVTTVIDMPNNKVPATTVGVLREKARLARAKALVGVFLFGGVVAENLGRLGSMRDEVVGFKVYLAETTGGLTFPSELLGEAMSAIGKAGRPASVHCEDQSVIDAANAASGGSHVLRRPPLAETRAVSEALAARGSTRLNVCHVSTARALAAIGRVRRRGGVACEATLHHLLLDERAARKNRLLRTNPPLRTARDRAALVDGLRSGGVDFLVTDHAPHTLEDKRAGAAGVPGLDNYANAVSWLVADAGFPPESIPRFTSANQAAFFGLAGRGEIRVGARADLAVLSMKSEDRVSRDELQTKCGWSPYEGMVFPGRARWTVVGGRVALDDFQLAA